MPTLSFRVTEEELAVIRHRMAITHNAKISTYLRRAALSHGFDEQELSGTGTAPRPVNWLSEVPRRNRELLLQPVQSDKMDFQTELIATIYLMLHSVIEPKLQAEMNGYVKVTAVQRLLEKFTEKRRNGSQVPHGELRN